MENVAKIRKRKVIRQKTRRQIRSFLNCYDFAYAGRDTVNQAAKVAPSIIKGATNETNNITQQRIDQIISQGGKEIERVLPKILRGAIEDVYQRPFRLLGDFGKKQLNKLKKQDFNIDVILFYFVYNQTIIIKIYITENVNWFHYSYPPIIMIDLGF